ncbi:glyoxalase/bleomycin resistance/extradiol dioxygenase family protein [Sphingomonas sp.]|uniref:VOC family protein n=1 Tax=Sphingomonas sp. TaxID=28214 RepID=UPI00286DA2B7|nr:glyoxalase/bleomycin resistance/extradiol dioxygenase family protein [Sphingomonas sp.]
MAHDQQGPSGGVTAHLTIRDNRAAEAIGFYAKAFGAEEAMPAVKEEGGERIMHAHLLLNGGHLMLNDDFPEYGGAASPPGSVTLHLQVSDADAAWNSALEAGATEKMPLADQFWGDRYGQVTDPFGHTWSIGAPAVPKQD